MVQPFEPTRSAALVKDALVMGVVGEYRAYSAQSLKLPQYTAGFEVFLSLVQLTNVRTAYRQISKYPKVSQDISLRLAQDVPYGIVADELLKGLAELADENLQTELTPLDIYQKDDVKHMTFRLTATHSHKTLKAAEVNELLDSLAERAHRFFGATRI